MGRWKDIKLKVFEKEASVFELYDLEKDPKETENIAAIHPEIVRQINQIMKEAQVENEVFPFLSRP